MVRGDATNTSDLDILIFDKNLAVSYRESFFMYDWPIEVFAHNFSSYQEYFAGDVKLAMPSLPRMVTESMILKDNGVIETIKKEAKELMLQGPEKWSTDTVDTQRYLITDILEDFIGGNNQSEDIFIANTLAELVSEFVLRTNNQWVGTSKWIVRSLREYDKSFADRLVDAFDTFYKDNLKDEVVILTNEVLKIHGGRFFAGYSSGKTILCKSDK